MYSGIVTHKRSVKKIGVHQRFNTAAYRMIAPYLDSEGFPLLKDIQHFEGVNGPDGLKIKSWRRPEASHIYDPEKGDGDIPRRIGSHYISLVASLKDGDLTRAAFEAGWLAHYVTDGLTPAHHFPLDRLRHEILRPDSRSGRWRRRLHWYSYKGAIPTHLNFEMGIAAVLLFFPLRFYLDTDKLAQARRVGAVEFFRQEAKDIAALNLYDKFCRRGWTADIAQAVRRVVAPQAAQTIGVIWLLAHLEASQLSVAEAPVFATV